MVLITTLFFGLALAVLLCIRCNTQLVYFQQEEYDHSRFFTAWKNVRLYDVAASVATIVLLIGGWLFSAPVGVMFCLSVVYLLIAWREHQYPFKKPLVNTERVRRIRAVALIILVVLAFIASFLPLFAIVALQCVPLTLLLSNSLLQPAQQRLNEGFVDEARIRLNENSAIPIGITGSFGKTTVKHMLAEMLDVGGPVFYSRGSVNTVLGLTRHIRQRLQPAHQYFVAEMGAYQIGSIQRLCEFVKPRYGIVTAVGEAHAERFGSIANTAKAKSELAQWVCEHGTKLITTESVMLHQPFAELQQRYPEKFTIVGASSASDVRIVDSQVVNGKWQISLQLNSTGSFSYELPLLGEHNVLNSALAVALIASIDPELLTRLAPRMAELQQVAHRLELKETAGEPLILDDAYNSNERGFLNAVELMRKLADDRGGTAVLVTPGIAELGDEHDEIHQRLGGRCADLCDVIVLVNPARIRSFSQAINSSSVSLIEVPTLLDARRHLADLKLSESDVVLYENDLPDLLEEKRLL